MEFYLDISNSSDQYFWMDWKIIEPHWKNSELCLINEPYMKNVYHKKWFKTKEDGNKYFIIPRIGYNNYDKCIIFGNGRHRTTILSRYINEIPFAVCESILYNDLFKDAIIKPVSGGDTIKLPNLPIISRNEIDGGIN